jgi:DUF4097 and DUF4098 domain-containing protein YvlB
MKKDGKETDEFRKSYKLTPGFRVALSGIRGPVDIECHDTDEAQVHIMRRAADRARLNQGKVTVEQAAETLVVRGAEEARVTHQVALKLPRRIALAVASVNGPVHIGAVDGPVTVKSVSGPCHVAGANGTLTFHSVSGGVKVGQLRGGLNVYSVSGRVSAGIVALDENGVHIKSISGLVELLFENTVDAEVNIENVSGKIDVQLEGVTRDGGNKRSSAHVIIGAGTSPISISGVSGLVRITQRR